VVNKNSRNGYGGYGGFEEFSVVVPKDQSKSLTVILNDGEGGRMLIDATCHGV